MLSDDLYMSMGEMEKTAKKAIQDFYKKDYGRKLLLSDIGEVNFYGVGLNKDQEIEQIVLQSWTDAFVDRNDGVSDWCFVELTKVPFTNASGQHVKKFQVTNVDCSKRD